MISLILPHKDCPENNAVLELKRRMLHDNTRCDYQLLYVSGTEAKDVYPTWNWLATVAKYDILLWDNSDILYAPGWDVAIRANIDRADWLGLRLIECGAIGVASSNIAADFGRTAASFDRDAFEAFCAHEANRHPEIETGFAWYSPSAFRRQWFIDMGMFPTEPAFPNPNDSIFRERVEAKGCRFAVVNGYAYHLQRARENMGERPERC